MVLTVPALRASADTAYLTITKSAPVSGGLSGKVPQAGQRFELDNFTVTSSAPQTFGSQSTGAGAGKAQQVSFSATMPLSDESARLLTQTSMIPEVRVNIVGKSDDDAITFKNCLMSTAQQTGVSVALTFSCLGMQDAMSSGKPGGGPPGGTVPVTLSRNLETFLEVGGQTVHITQFAVDEQTAGKLESVTGAGTAGHAPTSTLAFVVPLDGSAKVLNDLAGKGSQGGPLKVTFVKAGELKAKPLLVEQFANWSVQSNSTSYSGSGASDALIIRYGSLQVTYDATSSNGTPLKGQATPIPAGWDRVKNVAPAGSTTPVIPPK